MRRSGYRATTVVLLLLCLMYAITYVDRVNIATAAIAFRRDFNLSNIEYGWVFSAFAYTYAAFQIIGGFLGDRFGPRLTLATCGVIWGVATIAMGLTTGFWSLVLVRLLLGIGEGATFPTATRALAKWTKVGSRGFAQGITHSFARLGNSLAPPLVAALIVVWGWRGSFFCLGLLSCAWALVWFVYFRDEPADHAGISQAELDVLPKTSPASQGAATPWRPLLRRMLPTTLVYFCYGWTLWVYVSWLPQFFQQGQNLDLKSSALFSAAVFLAGVVGDTLGGVISDRILAKTGNLRRARCNLICLSFIGSLICLIPVLYTNNLTVLTASLAAAFFCLELSIGPVWSVPMDIAPSHAGTASGIMNTGAAIAAIISPTVFGYVVELTGSWTAPFFASIGLLLVGAAATFFMRPDRTLDVGEIQKSSDKLTVVGAPRTAIAG